MKYDLIVIGGGAAGIFAALSAKEKNRTAQVLVLEKTAKTLSKVRVSGGGRCNVTHALFDPLLLSQHYPRGHKELIGPFQRFQPKDTFEWFESKGVKLKIEEDGRSFPITDSSETIIECLLTAMKKQSIEIKLRQKIQKISKKEEGFEIDIENQGILFAKNLLIATGSSNEGYGWAKELGHTIVLPVPSLFTLNISHFSLKELSGLSVESVLLEIPKTSFFQKGPLLITHFGFSGPAALKLSAWAARYFFEKKYQVDLLVHWLPEWTQEEIYKKLEDVKQKEPQKFLTSCHPFNLPRNLWKTLVESFSELASKKTRDLSKKNLIYLSEKLHKDLYKIEGKTTHKEEFVTCGGVSLKEIDFKTMQSKKCPHLYFAGEILDIDGITGGFNFQAAWTTGYIAGTSSTES